VADVTRPGPTVRVRATVSTVEGDHGVEDRVAAEEPLELRLAGPGQPPARAWVTLRTPGLVFELAAGWVVHVCLALTD
jgi:FdhD protein